MTTSNPKPSTFLFSVTILIFTFAFMFTMTPWQLFQQMCPFLGVQNPQCMMFNAQQGQQQGPPPALPQQQQQPIQPLPQQQLQPGQNGLSRESGP